MRSSQLSGFLSILAIFAIDAILTDTDWQLAPTLFDSIAPDENWVLADPIAEADDVVNSYTYQPSDFSSMNDGQLFVNDSQSEWLADEHNARCSSSILTGKRRFKRSDEICSSDESGQSTYTSTLSIETDFDKAKCSGLNFFGKSILVCSSRKISIGIPFDTLYDSRRGKQPFSTFRRKHDARLGKRHYLQPPTPASKISVTDEFGLVFDENGVADCQLPGFLYCCADWIPSSPPRLSGSSLANFTPSLLVSVSLITPSFVEPARSMNHRELESYVQDSPPI